MATNPTTLPENSGRITGASTDYPRGSAKDDTTGTTGDGTPIKSGWMNDVFGPQQALLRAAGFVPSGNSDTALVSQYVQAMTQIAAGRATAYDDTGTADAYVLAIRSGQQAPMGLFDGMTVRFIASGDNTGACTVDVSALKGETAGTTVLDVKSAVGATPTAGSVTGYAALRYASATNTLVVDGVQAAIVDGLVADVATNTSAIAAKIAPNLIKESQCVVPSASAILPSTTASVYTSGALSNGWVLFSTTSATISKDSYGNVFVQNFLDGATHNIYIDLDVSPYIDVATLTPKAVYLDASGEQVASPVTVVVTRLDVNTVRFDMEMSTSSNGKVFAVSLSQEQGDIEILAEQTIIDNVIGANTEGFEILAKGVFSTGTSGTIPQGFEWSDFSKLKFYSVNTSGELGMPTEVTKDDLNGTYPTSMYVSTIGATYVELDLDSATTFYIASSASGGRLQSIKGWF